MTTTLRGQQFKPTDSGDLSIFLQDVCETCKHQEYCAILAHAGMYGGATEWRVIDGKPTCIRLAAAPVTEPLKPCPFCGGDGLYWDQMEIDAETVHFLVCRQCETQGPTGDDHTTAEVRWNKRVA